MKTKYFLIFLALALSLISRSEVYAQKCLMVEYDANGNRLCRYVVDNCYEMKGFEEIQETSVSGEIDIYPNPNKGCFKVVMPANIKNDNSYFELFDINGVRIYMNYLNKGETDVDMENMPAGIYLLKIINGDDVLSKIVLKQ